MKPGSWASILAIFLFGAAGASTVSKLIPLGGDLARVFGASPAEFGWLVSLIAVPAALLAIPSGIVVDKYGPRVVLIACAVLGVLSNTIYMFADSMPVLQLARLLEGAAIVHIYTAAPALLMATTDGKKRTTAMTVWATYMPVGTAIGLTLGGLFADGESWRSTFMAQAALYAVTGCLGFLLPTISADAATGGQPLAQRLLGLREAYSRPPLLLLALGFFMMISMGLGANATFPSYFARIHDMPTLSASSMVAAATLAMIPGSLIAGVILSSGVRHQVLFSGLAAAGFILGSLSFFPDLEISLRFIIVCGWFIISGAAIATIMATLPIVAEPQRRGAAAALINQSGALATFVNPPIWLSLAAGNAWTPFSGLLALGWTVATACLWAIALYAAAPAAKTQTS